MVVGSSVGFGGQVWSDGKAAGAQVRFTLFQLTQSGAILRYKDVIGLSSGDGSKRQFSGIDQLTEGWPLV
eukprot:TRINITY_DN5593_c0_g1_i1.p1 TRINITY_DN5593_c0_g1~~TRINITY_DN5593_c0_g1_i1.p1  ORF type:complete len:70 (+),score=9.91 TRINITY_DN5593_c0_g1_i1:223-432(+)